MQAIWNGEVIAESEDTVVVEGNHYFPASSVHRQYLSASDSNTSCPWKGTAGYYTITVNGKTNKNAAWYYPNPKPAAAQIAGRVAFWKGVKVVSGQSADPECTDCSPRSTGRLSALTGWLRGRDAV